MPKKLSVCAVQLTPERYVVSTLCPIPTIPDDILLQDALVIGARFDADVSTAACRLAFYGRAVALVDPADAAALARLRVAKLKAKRGVIERVGRDGRTAICRGMFKKETDLALFRGMKARSCATHNTRRDTVPCLSFCAGATACVTGIAAGTA